MIKAIIRKELRESYKLALAGAGVFCLLIAMAFDRTKPPLMDDNFQTAASFFCGIFGALLGWLQIRRENHPDLRAFLIHRPLSSTGIFFGKIIAGLALYLVTAGLPLVCLTILVRVPGQVAAPFDWGMVLPAVATFQAGVVCYFAGMLTGQPQARWRVTRSLALGAGLLAMAWQIREFWPTLLLVVVSSVILGTAARGGFVSSGDSRGQSVAAGITLPIAMVPGAAMLLMLAVSSFVYFIIRPNPAAQTYSQSYQMLTDGTVVKYSRSSFGNTVTDPFGRLIKDPKTSNYLGVDALYLRSAPSSAVMLLPEAAVTTWASFRNSDRFCRLVLGTPRIQWFYSFSRGRFLGYDTHTREFVGSLGPEGFATNSLAPDVRFNIRTGMDYNRTPFTLTDPHTIFLLENPSITEPPIVAPLFRVAANEVILTTADVISNGSSAISGMLQTVWQNLNNISMAQTWEATATVTSQYIYVISRDGTVLWKLPRPTVFSGDASLQVYLVNGPNQCALIVTPSAAANRKSNGTLSTHLEIYDHDASVVKMLDLPTLIQPAPVPTLEQKCLAVIGPPVIGATRALGLLVSALCAMVALALGLRARLSVRAQFGWMIFLLLTGVAGFFVFLCLQSWPARERCPNCKKLRVVNRDRCEHCAAAFAPAEKNGTEIFEPLGTV